MTATCRAAAPASAAELAELLRGRPGRVRLCGGGSRQDRLPDAGDALRVRLTGLASIARLDAPDRTCSVDCGVDRTELDAELARAGLELPCAGSGTIGGLFASDAIGAVAPGGPSPRTLLLGMAAVLADGTPFRSGARVVKSVAGFDVHRLLVGSQGRLFAATRLHLRLLPRPPAQQWFCNDGLDAGGALQLVQRLRQLAPPPAALQLQRDGNGAFAVCGRVTGRASFVAATMRALALRESAPGTREHVEPPIAGEVVAGLVLPGGIAPLLAALPATAPFVWHGGGRFEVATPGAAASDALLAVAPTLRVPACIVRGSAERRGRGTPLDPGHRRLVERLEQALDPHRVLC